jgi:transposase InsO family protein
MLIFMSRTTISATTEVRDRLAAVARSRGTTVSALLESIAARLDREEALRRATESYERLAREDPEGFKAYIAEGEAWDRATAADGLSPAREEYPELSE